MRPALLLPTVLLFCARPGRASGRAWRHRLGTVVLATLAAMAHAGPSVGAAPMWALDGTISPWSHDHRDLDVQSPKSAAFDASSEHLYINALEGGKTLIYRHVEANPATGAPEDWVKDAVLDHHRSLPAFDGHGTHEVMGKPVEMAWAPDGTLWIPYYRRSDDPAGVMPSAMTAYDPKTARWLGTWPTGNIPKFIAFSPDGHRLAVAQWGENTVGVWDRDGDRLTPEATWVVGHRLDPLTMRGRDRDAACGFCLRGMTFADDGHVLLVARMGGGGIEVFDADHGVSLGTVRNVAPTPRHLALSPDGTVLYVSSNVAGVVSRTTVNGLLDAVRAHHPERTVWQQARIGGGARTLVVSPQGERLYVALNNSTEVAVLDAQTLRVIERHPVAAYPVGLAISPDERWLVVTSQGHAGAGGGHVVTLFHRTAAPLLPTPQAALSVPSAAVGHPGS